MGALTTLLAIGAGVGAAVSAVGSISQGIAAKKAGRAQSEILRQEAVRRDQEATQQRKQARLDADEFRRRQSRLLARQRAGFGASGVSLEGTPLFVGADTAREIEFQAQKILVSGLGDASALEAEGSSLRSEAGLASMRGSQAATGSFFRAGSTLLTGAGRVGGFFEDSRPTVPRGSPGQRLRIPAAGFRKFYAARAGLSLIHPPRRPGAGDPVSGPPGPPPGTPLREDSSPPGDLLTAGLNPDTGRLLTGDLNQ